MNNYNNIIIGAGIAGLYTAYNIKKIYPNETFIILEQSNRIGGRVGSVNFYGVPISIGAGIGRYEKDILLKKLLKELKISFNKFTVDSQFSKVWKTHCDTVHYKSKNIENKKKIPHLKNSHYLKLIKNYMSVLENQVHILILKTKMYLKFYIIMDWMII